MPDLPQASPIVSDTQTITQDMSCLRCGYNLRGLRSDGHCPECGSPVERSLHGDQLRFADPNWLNTLRRGVALMLWNLLIVMVISMLAGLTAVLGAPPVVMQLATVIAAALALAAMYLVTAPEPTESFAGQTVKLRKAVRILAVIAFVGAIWQQGIGLFGGVVLLSIGAMLGFIGGFGHVGLLALLRRFALRVPDFRLASQTRIVLWAYAIGYGGALLVGLGAGIWMASVGGPAALAPPGAAVTTTVGPRGPGGASFTYSASAAAPPAPPSAATTGAPAAGAGTPPAGQTTTNPVLPATGMPAVTPVFGTAAIFFGCAAALVVLVFSIWYIVLLFRYHRLFRLAAAESAAWSQAAG